MKAGAWIVCSLWVVLGSWTAPDASAQEAVTEESRDARWVRAVYAVEAPALTVPLRAAHASALPVFVGAPPALWAGAFLTGADLDMPVALTATWLATYGSVVLLKNTIQRPRPFDALAGIERRGYAEGDYLDPFSFPSGHASLAFAIATSLSLSYPEWYVLAPAYLWATTTALSRVWLGVHYPSDIAVGALLGSGVALGVHLLANPLLGEEAEADPLRRPVPVVGFVIPIR